MQDLTWRDGLVIVGLLVIAIVAGRVLGHAIGWLACRLGAREGRTRGALVRRIADRFRAPLSLVIALGAWQLALGFVELPAGARDTLHDVGRVGLVLALVWIALRVVDFALQLVAEDTDVLAHHQVSGSLLPIGRRVAKVAIVAVAIVAVLGSLGYSITGLVAGLGITGIAVAFAAQKTLENVFGAFALGLDRPLREGDFVKVDTVQGTVEQIGLRSTRLRTPDRTVIAYPNGKLADSVIERFSARDRLRLDVKWRLALGATSRQYRQVRDAIAARLDAHPKRAEDHAQVHLNGPGDTWLELEATVAFATADYREFQAIRDELLLACLDAFADAGVDLSGAVTPPTAQPAASRDGRATARTTTLH
jgi:MscS family membrane protein